MRDGELQKAEKLFFTFRRPLLTGLPLQVVSEIFFNSAL